MNAPSPPSPADAAASGWRPDVIAGLQVSLIALPLSLGIAIASGFPPVAGLITAMVGGLIATWFGSAPLTIKGPAAGLIVIALGAVTELGHGDAARGYRLALAAVVAAGVLQVVFALLRAGRIGQVIPPSVVHGMLAAIGIIIFAKQSHVMLGVTPLAKEPLHLLAEIPRSILSLNPEVAVIGFGALALLIAAPIAAKRFPALRRVPAPFLALLIAVPLGLYFDLSHQHTYTFSLTHHAYPIGPRFLVNLPGSLLQALTLPDFSQIATPTSLKYIVMFALVGSIESLLTVRAVDALDPAHHRSDLNRDLLATGVGNIVAGALGGLPMISEIVRSSANLSFGARSRRANFTHGLALFLAVALVPGLIHRVPLAALAAMLVVTGARLASPKEFAHTLHIGADQLALFVTTTVVTLATDLLVGVMAGLALKVVLSLVRGASPREFFRANLTVDRTDERAVVRLHGASLFTNLPDIVRAIEGAMKDRPAVVVDFRDATLVDHTTLSVIEELRRESAPAQCTIEVVGLQALRPGGSHPLAARVRVAAPEGAT